MSKFPLYALFGYSKAYRQLFVAGKAMEIIMNYIDLFFMVLIILMIIAGYARGFLQSLLSFARFLVGVPLSFYISDKYYSVVYNNYVKDYALGKITSGIEGSVNVDEYVLSIKDSVSNLPFNLGEAVDLSFLNNTSSSSLASSLLDNVVQPIAIIIIKFLLFALTLILFYVITLIIANAIKGILKAVKLPFEKADRFLGAVLGTAKAVVAVLVFGAVFAFILEIGIADANGQFVSQLNSSAVLEFVNKYNPILSIM